MYFVYALKSINRKLYLCWFNLRFRGKISRHNNGYEKTTKPYRHFILIYSEEQANRIMARSREKYLKSGAGKEFLKSLL